MKSSQGRKGEESLKESKEGEPRPNTPSGFHEYPNLIQEGNFGKGQGSSRGMSSNIGQNQVAG